MALLDFLFEGTPPPQVTSYGSTSANLPDWFSAYAQALAAKASAVAGEPYQGYTGPRVAPLTVDQTGAYGAVRGALGTSAPRYDAAGNLVAAGGTASSLGAADPLIAAARGLSPTGAAAPYLAGASGTFPEAASAYMSPYITGVTDRIAELGTRNLTENVLPRIQDEFIAAGQPGSSRSAEFSSRAVRDAVNEIAGQQSLALQSGYGLAGSQYATDAARKAALAATAGGLTGTEQGALGNLAQLTGQLTGETAGRGITAGTQLGALAGARQQTGTAEAAALEAAGAAEQANQQQNLDVAYQRFLEERNYPRTNIELLNAALRGVPMATSTTTTGTAPATVMGSSPLAQIAGGGLSAAAIYSLLNKKARGGRIRGALSHG